jgi:hypothetical protein
LNVDVLFLQRLQSKPFSALIRHGLDGSFLGGVLTTLRAYMLDGTADKLRMKTCSRFMVALSSSTRFALASAMLEDEEKAGM